MTPCTFRDYVDDMTLTRLSATDKATASAFQQDLEQLKWALREDNMKLNDSQKKNLRS